MAGRMPGVASLRWGPSDGGIIRPVLGISACSMFLLNMLDASR
jgi:hypothetical protein